jgi:RsiW-degrading membrane proteinase PrsW (M82 family)
MPFSLTFLLASISPVIIFLYLIYQRDHVKEPWKLLLSCLVGGMFSTFLSLTMSWPASKLSVLFPGNFLSSLHLSFLTAAIPEEVAKFAVLYWIVWKRPEFDHHYDGIIYSVFVSLGFALVENLLYVAEGGLGVAFFRAILAVPGHGFFGVIMGYYFSLARFHENPKRRQYLIEALLLPILFHGGYDFLLFYMSSSGAASPLLAVVLLVLFTALVIKLWRRGFRKISLHLVKDGEHIAAQAEGMKPQEDSI